MNSLDPLATQQSKQMGYNDADNNNNDSDYCEDGVIYDEFFGDNDVLDVDNGVDNNNEDLHVVWDVEAASIDSPSIL